MNNRNTHGRENAKLNDSRKFDVDYWVWDVSRKKPHRLPPRQCSFDKDLDFEDSSVDGVAVRVQWLGFMVQVLRI